ncbi:hypothetical protein PR048_008693 [Dryococelus australis]|uniref:Uncharacterized protein n=1 Tax=Dryococelus australis TaxID=614101 RepID=A0ABQ9HXU8_9NEOP|nr:hypothetical protein PR048_008693 [Dryococelus australis]
MSHFSHVGIMKITHQLETGKGFNPNMIKELCEYYNLDNDIIASELETFRNMYKFTHADIDISNIGFTKPYMCVLNLPALSNLTVMYRILLSIAVISCSVERTMIRLKIVKKTASE